MALSLDDVIAAAARWIATAIDELSRLTADVRDLFRHGRVQWRSDPQFRASVLRNALEGVSAAAIRGPRAAVLWTVAVAGEFIVLLATTLRDDPPVPSPAA